MSKGHERTLQSGLAPGASQQVSDCPRSYQAGDPVGLKDAAGVARRGGLIVYPTDTLYGLGTNALHSRGVQRLLQVKGRSPKRGLPVLISEPDEAEGLVTLWPTVATDLAARFWPGALTLVLPSSSKIPALVVSGSTVALRVPDHPVARALIREAGCPLIGTSANRSGDFAATTGDEALATLGPSVDVVLDAGRSRHGQPSTVLDLSSPPAARVVRPGTIASIAIIPLLEARGWCLVDEPLANATPPIGPHPPEAREQ